MRIAKTICVTLPPDLLKKARKIAVRESRTMSELVREALRHYMKEGERGDRKVDDRASAIAESGSNVIHSFRMEKTSK